MKKYYYSDPLAAAYMARNHGVRFEPSHDDVVDVIGLLLTEISGDGLKRTFTVPVSMNGDNSILPDSLDIFRPRPGDIVTSAEGSPILVTEGFSGRSARVDAKQVQEAALDPRNDVRIIQRDGKAFFWPESEEV